MIKSSNKRVRAAKKSSKNAVKSSIKRASSNIPKHDTKKSCR